MKWDVSKLRPETIGALLMGLIYSKDFIKLVYSLFGFKTYFADTDKLETYRYAAVVDEATNRVWIVFRGTGGRNWIGRALSWFGINFNLKTDAEGFHPGFRRIAEKAVADCATWMRQATEVYIATHSQGSGTSVPFIALICRMMRKGQFKNIKRFEAHLFCSPPAVNDIGKDEIDEYILAGYVSIMNFKMDGDLISGKALRQKKGLLAGRDVGKVIVLTDVIRKKYWFADAVSHSPTVILTGFVLWLHENFETSTNDDKTLINHVLDEYFLVN